MKKKLSTLALGAIAFSTVNAQGFNETEKNYVPQRLVTVEKYYGARQGGFAISFGADPVVNFVGNMFNGTTDQRFEGFKGLGTDLFNGATISGKYMLKDDVAITLGLGFNNESTKNHIYDYKDQEKETAVKTNASHNFMMLVGMQKLLYPGKRLQPILGINLAYCYSNADYDRFDNKEGQKIYNGHPSHTFGLLGNVGVEYFLLRNISLSATVDLGVCKTWTKDTHTGEKDNDSNYSRVNTSSYELKTGQFGGNLAMNFYF